MNVSAKKDIYMEKSSLYIFFGVGTDWHKIISAQVQQNRPKCLSKNEFLYLLGFSYVHETRKKSQKFG